MGKFDKNTNCFYCQKEMISKNRNKKFCSDKCRVYFRRENVQLIAKKTGQNLSQVSTKIATEPPIKELTKAEIFKLIREGKM
jgi:hypothetical protein